MAESSEPSAQVLSHVQAYHDERCLESPIYKFLLSEVTFTHASRGLIVARMPVRAEHLNNSGSIHGSVSATIVDWAGGLAIAAWDRRDQTGPSVDINVSYLGTAGDGIVEIEGRVDRLGSNLGFTSVGIWRVDAQGKRGAPIILGRHTKFLRFSKAGPGLEEGEREKAEKI
ncbi:putative esterase C31F10.02 [Ceratocystis fimbriata CBS 114723]|uniref:Putative esterase C31F10.02 n=1 Tax=Ceratocystis fimbriata CBS 114723 TaxID=1035309 RepID=A0A2C5WM67_9PEZI|nr:putative esterase C31F10.02 [Ceratocystis fimbriata CBS 114723]